MAGLLVKPKGTHGKVHDISPQSAGWQYVGFGLYRLEAGDEVREFTGQREAILVLVEGKARLRVTEGDSTRGNPVTGTSVTGTAGTAPTPDARVQDFGILGDRMDVFEKKPPHCLYVPNGSTWTATASTACTLAVCTAPGKGGHQASRLGPEGISLTQRGQGANTRFIHNIAMEDRDVADSLLVTEVFTPSGNWSSYPSHRHDLDNYPETTYLEETYYHRLNPVQGFSVQRVYTEDGSLDETMSVSNHEVVLVPRGHHPCGVPYGYELYYLNVMAGPRRQWRFKNDPAHDWLYQRDNPDGLK